jgi:hypothetical protein
MVVIMTLTACLDYDHRMMVVIQRPSLLFVIQRPSPALFYDLDYATFPLPLI